MKNAITQKHTTVFSSTRISPSFQRIVVTGESLAALADDCAGQYIKLLFAPDAGSEVTRTSGSSKPAMRTYTIRGFDPIDLRLTIDFVVHDGAHGGLASHWAMNAKIGDVLTFAGPGPIKSAVSTESEYLFVADMTALPAAAVAIERLDRQARGKAYIQVAHRSDIQELDAPKGVDIEWLIGDSNQPLLANSVSHGPKLAKDTAIWCACEFNQMRSARRLLSNDANYNHQLAYFSSYWKPGVTEDGHKKIKQEDAKLAG